MPRRDLPQAPTVDRHLARIVLTAACWAKVRHETPATARDAIRSARVFLHDDRMRVYRCPFSSLYGEHWHVGHPPSLHRLVRLAAVMRWCNDHRDDVPAPTVPAA